jgi:tight adherence protein B
MPLFIAALVFLAVVVLIVGIWWASEGRRRVRERMEGSGPIGSDVDTEILRVDPREGATGLMGTLSRTSLFDRLTVIAEQAGYQRSVTDIVLIMAAFASGGALVGWFRTGSPLWTLLAAALGGSLPVFYLLYRRSKRIQRFEKDFPDALDAMARSIRAGNALSAAIQIVGEDMPEPVGPEFKRVVDEIRLGLDPGEALVKLGQRIQTEDMRFFCSAIRIQRGAGGNLAEVLDRLAEVIRERYKILSHARVLSAQHKYSAICVGLAPIIFAIMLELFNPGYFEPLLTSPVGPLMIGAGAVFEAIGFFMIWRIAQIKV